MLEPLDVEKLFKKMKAPCRCNVKIDIFKRQWIKLLRPANDREKIPTIRIGGCLCACGFFLVFHFNGIFLYVFFVFLSIRRFHFINMKMKKQNLLIDRFDTIRVLKREIRLIQCGTHCPLNFTCASKMCVNIHLLVYILMYRSP